MGHTIAKNGVSNDRALENLGQLKIELLRDRLVKSL